MMERFKENRAHEKQADKIEVMRELRAGSKTIFNEDDAKRISAEFIRNAKRLAEIAL